MAEIVTFDNELFPRHFVNVSPALSDEVERALVSAIGYSRLEEINTVFVRRVITDVENENRRNKVGTALTFKRKKVKIQFVITEVREETEEVYGSLYFPVHGDGASISMFLKKVASKMRLGLPYFHCKDGIACIYFLVSVEGIAKKILEDPTKCNGVDVQYCLKGDIK